MRESPEQKVHFDARSDLTLEQRQALFDHLREYREFENWRFYLELYVKLSSFWPDMPGEPPISTFPLEKLVATVKELFEREPGQFDIRLRVAADLKAVGLPTDSVFDPRSAAPEFLQDFDRRSAQHRIDIDFTKDAFDIARLGLRPVAELFVDRDKAWKEFENRLKDLKLGESVQVGEEHLELIAYSGGVMKLLFPERANQIPLSQAEVKIMKDDLVGADPQASGAVIAQALGLTLLTAEEVSFGPRGEYIIQSSQAGLVASPKLPERPLA